MNRQVAENTPEGSLRQTSEELEKEESAHSAVFYEPSSPSPTQQDWNYYHSGNNNNSGLDVTVRNGFYGSSSSPSQYHLRSFSTLSGSNSFYSEANGQVVADQFQDEYAGPYNVDFYTGATGDSYDVGINGDHSDTVPVNDYMEFPETAGYPAPMYPYVTTTTPALSPVGTVFLVLRHCIRVDLTADKAIFVTNYPGSCVGVISSCGNRTCINHPNGKVYQDSNTVNMESGPKVAKFCPRGVVFSSTEHSLAYLVDSAGTKTTSDKFMDLSENFPLSVFFENFPPDNSMAGVCFEMMAQATHRTYSNGDEVWYIGGIRIKQNPWGEVRISAAHNKKVLRTSPTINSMSIATPGFFVKISCHPFRHFLVRKGDRAVCAGSTGLAVQHGSQKAGFDRMGRLILF